MTPAAPVRVALRTRNAGRGVVVVPVSGAIGVGALTMTAGPMLNLSGALNGPAVPPLVARARQ